MKLRFLATALVFCILLSLTVFGADYDIKTQGHIEEAEGAYIIYIEIRTNLPEGAKLEAEVYYAKKYLIPPSLREPGEPEYNIEQIYLAKGTETVGKEGLCAIKAGNYARKPYIGEYLIKVFLDPESQPGEVTNKLPPGIKTIEKSASFTFGKPEELEKQKQGIKQEIYETVKQIKELHRALEKEVAGQTAGNKFNADRWKNWSDGWQKILDGIKESNKSRLEERIYQTETVGKHVIAVLCGELERMAKDYANKAQSSASLKPVETDFTANSNAFQMLFEDNTGMLRFDIVKNKPLVKSVITEIEKQLGLIDKLYEEVCISSDKKKWNEAMPEYKNNIQKEIFELAGATSDYIYATYLVSFTQDFIKYLDGCSEKTTKTPVTIGEPNLLFSRLKKALNEIKETLEIE